MKIGRASFGHALFAGCNDHAVHVTDPDTMLAEIVIRRLGTMTSVVLSERGAERNGPRPAIWRDGRWVGK